ncbi:MAG: alpha/beta fold hydrolase [Prevotella sp.]|nr:alpha/beta fold hydrolase [Prevotella sp.]
MDIEHFFMEKGQGEALILLHGNGENSDYFQGQIDEFARHYHVYAIDTRGHGKTPRGNAPFTIRQFADDLLGFMDVHQIKKAHVLGFSDGGNIAMIFALKHPDRVNRLILNGANLNAKGVKCSVQTPIEIGYRFARLFARMSKSAKLHAEMLGLMVNDPNVSPEELKGIQAKTLVMAGTDDIIKEEHTRLIAQSIPDARLVFIKGSHFIANECPQAFNKEVLEFLKV